MVNKNLNNWIFMGGVVLANLATDECELEEHA